MTIKKLIQQYKRIREKRSPYYAEPIIWYREEPVFIQVIDIVLSYI